jgi:hypothetical protein
MTETLFTPVVLQAALRRQGIWLLDATGMPTDFYHKTCFRLADRPMPTHGQKPEDVHKLRPH